MARRVLACILLLSLLATLAGTVQARSRAADSTALIYVNISSPDDLSHFQATGLPLFSRLDQAFLTGANAAGRQALAGAGLSFQVLDPDVDALLTGASTERIYRAYLAPNRSAPDWSAYGHLLLALDGEAILRATPEQAERLTQAGAEILRVSLTPKPLPQGEVVSVAPQAVTPDPLIQSMIDQVHSDDISNYDRQLAGELPVWVEGDWYTITSRNTNSGTPIYKTTHWYGEQFANLGLDLEYYVWSNTNNPDVIGELPGLTNPDDIFIIGGHIDDVTGTPGADDNASGPIAVLEAANIMTQYQWGCTLRFAVWTGEEQGLLGSEAYAAHVHQGGENIVGYLNLDMIAWNTLNSQPGIDLVYNASMPSTQQLAQLFADVVSAYNINLVPDMYSDTTPDSDHASFWDQGYTAILGIEDFDDFNPYYHGPQDTPAHTDLTYFTDFTKASLATFAHMSGCLIPAGIGYLDGHATEQGSGLPIQGVTVTAADNAGHSFPATTDATGYYTRTLLSNSYTVTATHPQYVTAVVPNVQVLTDTTTTQDFSLVHRGWVWGYVTDADNGFPLAATVSVPGFGSVDTDPGTGYYEIYTDGGSRTVTAGAPNYADGTATIDVTLGQGTRQDFGLLADISFVPNPLHVYVPLGGIYDTPATITNRLGSDYDLELFEIPGGGPGLLEATAPAGVDATWPGPDGFGYTGEAVDYEWVEISSSGTPVPGLDDDTYAGPFNVGFAFPFYGTNRTQFYLASNGYLSFGSGSSAWQNQCPLPDSGTPNDLVAPMWDDLYPNYTSGGLYYQSFPSCPVGGGACLIVEYRNWEHCCSGTMAGTFETILMENGSVRMQYQDTGDETGSGSATAIEGNNAGSDYGLTYACHSANSLPDGLSVCFVYPNSAGCVAADVPWLGEDPTAGTIPAGDSLDVTMLFSATSAAGVTQPGDYFATLLVAGSPSIRVPVTMTVYPSGCNPVEILTVTQEISGCSVPLGADLAGDAPFTYLWDFGPFGTSTDPNPVVDFGQSGSYPVHLDVANCDGYAHDTSDFSVTVDCGGACVPVEVQAVDELASGCVVTYSATLAGDPPWAYLWDFGAFGTSTETNPVVDYGQSGTYLGVLTASNCAGTAQDSLPFTTTVDCTPICDPVSGTAFDWAPQQPGTGEEVTFAGVASGTEPISFTWDLGDGTLGAGATIAHSYALSGTYRVTMVAENECGEQTVTHTIVVTAPISCDPPAGVAFNWAPLTPTVGEAVSFSAVASGTEPIGLAWSFGDDSSGSGEVVTHTYVVTGSYTVALTATNACGVQTLTHVLVVAAPQPRVWSVYLPLVVKND